MSLEIKDDIDVVLEVFRFKDPFGKQKILLDFIAGLMAQNFKELAGEAADRPLVNAAGFQEKDSPFIEQVIPGGGFFERCFLR